VLGRVFPLHPPDAYFPRSTASLKSQYLSLVLVFFFCRGSSPVFPERTFPQSPPSLSSPADAFNAMNFPPLERSGASLPLVFFSKFSPLYLFKMPGVHLVFDPCTFLPLHLFRLNRERSAFYTGTFWLFVILILRPYASPPPYSSPLIFFKFVIFFLYPPVTWTNPKIWVGPFSFSCYLFSALSRAGLSSLFLSRSPSIR